jgi:hypothetical protein
MTLKTNKILNLIFLGKTTALFVQLFLLALLSKVDILQFQGVTSPLCINYNVEISVINSH